MTLILMQTTKGGFGLRTQVRQLSGESGLGHMSDGPGKQMREVLK